MINLTLRDIIEVYEERITELKRQLEGADQDAQNARSDRQHTINELTDARAVLADRTGCRNVDHRAYRDVYDTTHPYRRKHTEPR